MVAAVDHHVAGRFAEAEQLYRQTLAISPEHPDALHNLGYLAYQVGRPDIAVELIGRSVAINPGQVMAQNNLGNALRALGRLDEAAVALGRAQTLQPGSAMVLNNLANVFRDLGKLDKAEAALRRAIKRQPDFAEAHCNLGTVLKDQNKLGGSIASYRRATALKPDYADAFSNLGNALLDRGEFEEAIGAYEQALAIQPDSAVAHFNLGNARLALAQLDLAEASYSRAVAIRPNFWQAYDNRLFALNYSPSRSAEAIYSVYRAYNDDVAAQHQSSWTTHSNDRSPNRRLRIGYVSPDFRAHPVRHFLEPLLHHHDRAQFEIYAYAENDLKDETTNGYRAVVDQWMQTGRVSDQSLADRIRTDQIDILVDLAGHTHGNRLGVFALKPAPISVTWLGYAYTTGLSAIDYFLTDAIMAPPGSEGLFSEKPWRLDGPSYAFRPSLGMGDPGPLPATKASKVVFGSLSRAVRINAETVRVWSALLNRTGGDLVLNSKDFQYPELRDPIITSFASHGIAPGRLRIGYNTPAWDVLRGIDIGLDCFPHNSGTTLFESLTMGVPFVTLVGRPSVGRLGASILTALGRSEWIAETEEAYLEIASNLASDVSKLAQIRAGLRAEMRASLLMNEPRFALTVEAAYHQMWKHWVSTQSRWN